MQQAVEVSTFTCICCPLGCPLEVSFDAAGSVADVVGNICKRGAQYAAREATAPERMVTAVLPVAGCLEPVSVKTTAPVPKACVSAVLEACRGMRLAMPVAAGEVLIADVCGTGVAVVVTKSVP
ncbi:DUF1667 domain-containing protein [Gordonibacter sp.]|uniref:DUF1667 domain-containing protein n=1 Tax=Gordonibacter sp. TaxID=1968902 RepID=UPI002FCA387F